MLLARQSGKMAQKNNQDPVADDLAQTQTRTFEIEQRYFLERERAFARRWRIHNANRLSRSALLMTDTELKVMATLAITGLSSMPKKG
jgi:hypothetical protein